MAECNEINKTKQIRNDFLNALICDDDDGAMMRKIIIRQIS